MDYKGYGARTTGANLVIHFRQRVGTTIRDSSVRFPLKDLVLSAQVTDGLDRAARRVLVEHWSGLDIPDDPLF